MNADHRFCAIHAIVVNLEGRLDRRQTMNPTLGPRSTPDGTEPVRFHPETVRILIALNDL